MPENGCRVLRIRAEQPTRAYTLLAQLEQERGKLGPPTVYRALDFLIAHKLIHKVETSNAFVACGDVEHSHESQFMICEDCGATEEIRDDDIVRSLRRLGEGRGFAVERQVIEARGPDSTQPFLVRWDDSGHVTIFYPGSDCLVEHLREKVAS